MRDRVPFTLGFQHYRVGCHSNADIGLPWLSGISPDEHRKRPLNPFGCGIGSNFVRAIIERRYQSREELHIHSSIAKRRRPLFVFPQEIELLFLRQRLALRLFDLIHVVPHRGGCRCFTFCAVNEFDVDIAVL